MDAGALTAKQVADTVARPVPEVPGPPPTGPKDLPIGTCPEVAREQAPPPAPHDPNEQPGEYQNEDPARVATHDTVAGSGTQGDYASGGGGRLAQPLTAGEAAPVAVTLPASTTRVGVEVQAPAEEDSAEASAPRWPNAAAIWSELLACYNSEECQIMLLPFQLVVGSILFECVSYAMVAALLVQLLAKVFVSVCLGAIGIADELWRLLVMCARAGVYVVCLLLNKPHSPAPGGQSERLVVRLYRKLPRYLRLWGCTEPEPTVEPEEEPEDDPEADPIKMSEEEGEDLVGGNYLGMDHICPIRHEVMRDPVVASDGHAYERAEIRRWLRMRQSSPLTNERLAHSTLVQDSQKRADIEAALKKLRNSRGSGSADAIPAATMSRTCSQDSSLSDGYADRGTLHEVDVVVVDLGREAGDPIAGEGVPTTMP